MINRTPFLFILARYGSLLISFSLSLLYSSQLGLLNRAIAGFVFLVGGVLVVSLTQGLGIKLLQLHSQRKLDFKIARLYFYSSSILLLLGLAIFNSLVAFFLNSLNHSKISIYVIVSFYFACAFFGQMFYDLLLRTAKYSELAHFLLFQTLLSPTLYLLFQYSLGMSVFVSIYSSLGFAFLLSIIFVIVKNHELRKSIALGLASYRVPNSYSLHRNSFLIDFIKSFYLVLVERLDKFLFLFTISLETFSKVLVAQSFLFFFKPAQEIWINSSMKTRGVSGSQRFTLVKVIFILLFGLIALVIAYFLLVQKLLGSNWLLPIPVFATLFFLEMIKLFILGKLTQRMVS